MKKRYVCRTSGRYFVFLVTAILCVPVATQAADQSRLREAMGNLSGDNTRCYTYYSVIPNCIRKQDPVLAGKTDDAAQRSLKQSFETGKAGGLSQKAMLARTEIDLKEMSADIDNDCVNVAVLLNKHSAFCKDLQEHGADRLQAIIDAPRK
jgi:hypothetical protein